MSNARVRAGDNLTILMRCSTPSSRPGSAPASREPTPAQAQRLAADRRRRGRADHRAHRLGQDARRVPGLPRPAGPRGAATAARCPTAPRVLYVSPLKALSNDVRRNLEEPLGRAARRWRRQLGYPAPEIRTAVRTGDTPARERRADGAAAAARPGHHARVALHPAHRRSRAGAALARRAHRDRRRDPRASPATSAARTSRSRSSGSTRWWPRGGARLQRIGLSATHAAARDVAARLLVGDGAAAARRSSTSASGATSTWRSRCPSDELGAVCTNEQWDEIYDRVAALAREHRSTLVFVNTRRLVERVDARTSASGSATSASPRTTAACRASARFDAEQRLKAGELEVVVATASLELGIDVGAVDLVCLHRLAALDRDRLQRVGRSGHALRRHARRAGSSRSPATSWSSARRWCARPGAASSTRVAPARRAARRPGAADRRDLRRARSGTRTSSSRSCRRAAPYARARARATSTQVVDMLSEGIATSRGRARRAAAPRRASTGGCAARRGARLAALTSGGAIPDNANYDVVAGARGDARRHARRGLRHRVAWRATSSCSATRSWRIRRVESGRVRVEDAGGAPPTIPFWLGEAPARTRELSAEVAALRAGDRRRALRDGEDRGAVARCARLRARPPRRRAARATTSRRARPRSARVPTQTRVVAERFFDEAGGMQLVIHAPFGGRINRAWGLALRKRFCRIVRLRAAGRGHRRRHRALARPAAQLPARDGLRDAARRATSRSC